MKDAEKVSIANELAARFEGLREIQARIQKLAAVIPTNDPAGFGVRHGLNTLASDLEKEYHGIEKALESFQSAMAGEIDWLRVLLRSAGRRLRRWLEFYRYERERGIRNRREARVNLGKAKLKIAELERRYHGSRENPAHDPKER